MKVVFKCGNEDPDKIALSKKCSNVELFKTLFTTLKTIEKDLDEHLKKDNESNENIE